MEVRAAMIYRGVEGMRACYLPNSVRLADYHRGPSINTPDGRRNQADPAPAAIRKSRFSEVESRRFDVSGGAKLGDGPEADSRGAVKRWRLALD
jgi:hypothetical protein